MEEDISQQQSENTQTFPASVPNSSLKSKLPLISAALLLFVFVGTIGFFLGKSFSQPKTSPPSISQVSPTPTTQIPTPTPTTDPTANWKTYTDTDFGVLFKYPQAWTVGGVRKDPANPKTGDVTLNTDNDGYEITFNVYDNPSNLDYVDFMKKFYPSLSDRYKNVTFKSIAMINGVHFQQIIATSAGELGDIVFQTNRRLYVISGGSFALGPLKENSPLYNTLIQILSTFKFLD